MPKCLEFRRVLFRSTAPRPAVSAACRAAPHPKRGRRPAWPRRLPKHGRIGPAHLARHGPGARGILRWAKRRLLDAPGDVAWAEDPVTRKRREGRVGQEDCAARGPCRPSREELAAGFFPLLNRLAIR